MRHDQLPFYLPLLQAWAEGKTIQYKPSSIGTLAFPWGVWTDVPKDMDWFFGADSPSDYRIKPEPREFWIVTCRTSPLTVATIQGCFKTLEEAEKEQRYWQKRRDRRETYPQYVVEIIHTKEA